MLFVDNLLSSSHLFQLNRTVDDRLKPCSQQKKIIVEHFGPLPEVFMFTFLYPRFAWADLYRQS